LGRDLGKTAQRFLEKTCQACAKSGETDRNVRIALLWERLGLPALSLGVKAIAGDMRVFVASFRKLQVP